MASDSSCFQETSTNSLSLKRKRKTQLIHFILRLADLEMELFSQAQLIKLRAAHDDGGQRRLPRWDASFYIFLPSDAEIVAVRGSSLKSAFSPK